MYDLATNVDFLFVIEDWRRLQNLVSPELKEERRCQFHDKVFQYDAESSGSLPRMLVSQVANIHLLKLPLSLEAMGQISCALTYRQLHEGHTQ